VTGEFACDCRTAQCSRGLLPWLPYRFKTIKPGAYPAGPETVRPSHIHFDVAGRQDRLITQMYFDGDPYNEKDRFLQSVRRPDRLIVKLQPAKPELDPEALVAVFDIVLAKG
jgi:protocatechuate 3,4-dioxygenase beta subunit